MGFKTRTIGVVGLGHVGAHVAFNLGMMGVADMVKLCDPNEKKMRSEQQDCRDAVMFMPHHVRYESASYEDLADCDIIINALGNVAILQETQNRDTEMAYTVAQTADMVPKVMKGGFQGIFLNITNPCDVVTDLIQKLSGLPKNHVFGTGTGLDTSRLVNVIAQETGLDYHSFTAYMFGEHGNAQMAPWSLVRFGGQPLDELAKVDKRFAFDRAELQKKAIMGGWVTYSGKQCTEYGISSCAVTMASLVLHDAKKIMPASASLDGQYGEKGIYCGIPCVIGADGIEHVMEYTLTAQEQKDFASCCETIRQNIQKAESIWKK